jgi:HEAT repeat protein
VEPLIAILQSGTNDCQKEAAEALGKIGDERAIEPLKNTLNDDRWFVRQHAAIALKKIIPNLQINKSVTQPEQETTTDKVVADSEKQEEMIEVTKIEKDKIANQVKAPAIDTSKKDLSIRRETKEPLTNDLLDEDSNIRRKAARTLGKKGKKSSVEPLIDALEDEESLVRKSAAWALGKIGDSRAVLPLISILSDKDINVRKNAAWALGMIGDKRAMKPLISIAAKDSDSYVRDTAKKAIEKIKGN